MNTCAIVGVNWGDEGKGRIVDLLAEDYNIVVRYQGGSNAGHTVVNDLGKFALNLLPSGVFRPDVVNVLGNGVALDPEHLCGELEKLRSAGITITPDNLKISERASIVFPFHKELDSLEEQRLSDKKYGSTKRGIAPVYSDKYRKKTIQLGEFSDPERFRSRLADILDWENLLLHNVYGAPRIEVDDLMLWCDKYLAPIAAYTCDLRKFFAEAEAMGKSIMFEAQLGALRDLELGIYPYTSSSSPLACYAPLGSGAPWIKVSECIGVVKAYSTCVGEGPFVVEWFDERADKLREVGGEYGAATGRPRRVGPLDLPATRYGAQLQGTTRIALTKLDVLAYMDQIPVCTAYKLADGTITRDFPFTADLYGATPVIEYMDGFKQDVSKIRNYADLPAAAQRYVEFIERELGCPISHVSVGPERDAIILR